MTGVQTCALPISVLLGKGFLSNKGDIVGLFEGAACVAGGAGLVLLAVATLAFTRSARAGENA